ncbi:F-box family protein [Rhynchospora pubera]|uniref:F-box family protein n=1 Tax=Rhynchospora pubera TaxID=906938 RepID=A0AAV8EN88_9POAL|nr:F-box family protein [Rhynchospora pubera]
MAGVDRISALPEEMKVSILSYLPTTDAVRTSALSRSWRHLWTFLTGLHAYLDLYSRHRRHSIGSAESFSHILSSFRGPIHHFSLRCFLDDSKHSYLQRFLDIIFQKGGLWALSVDSMHLPVPVQLPSLRSLKDLHLEWVDISLPSDFHGFEQLINLNLHYVCISHRDVQLLIDGSKKLMSIELSIQHFKSPEDAAAGEEQSSLVCLNCPLLNCLRFEFKEENQAKLRIVSSPCLEIAHITMIPSSVEWTVRLGAATLNFMPDIAHISHLTLNIEVFECLAFVDEEVPHTLPVHFRQLRCLKLIDPMFYMNEGTFKWFCCFLRSMPFLENLELQCVCLLGLDEEDGGPFEYKKKEDGYLCLDQTLRRVTIFTRKLRDLQDLMWMIHFILLNANVLELIEITYSNDIKKIKPRILEELCEIDKASADAHVVFVDINDMS